MEIINNSVRVPSQNVTCTLKQSLLGLTAINQDLTLLDYGNVIVRKDYKSTTTVKILSGGCASKDLDYAELVGNGMLTGAVFGDNEIESPCSRLVLRTIRELCLGNEHGVLIITQSNSELFNFGLAIDRAQTDCLRARILAVNDNRSSCPILERNSCGILFVMKVAGAMSDQQCTFDEIFDFCHEISNNVISLTLSSLIDNSSNAINGFTEPKKIKLSNSSMHKMTYPIEDLLHLEKIDLKLEPSSSEIAIILNPHRKVKKMMQLNLIARIIDHFNSLQIKITRFYYGNYLSSKMKRLVTVTILKISNDKVINYLDSPCNAVAWQSFNQFLPNLTTANCTPSGLSKKGKLVIPIKGPKLKSESVNILQTCLEFACSALISCDRQLNVIDAETSNGNIGSRFKRAGEHVQKRLQNQKLMTNCPYALLRSLGVIVESGLGGTLGSIYGILFESASGSFLEAKETEEVTWSLWLEALSLAVEGLEKYCGEGDRLTTMYHPLKSCEAVILEQLIENQDFMQSLGLGVATAEKAAQNTKLESCKHPDAGAHAVGIWLRAIYEGIKLFCPDLQ